MKKNIFKTLFIILALLFLSSCEDYLDKAPESTLTKEEIFKDFDHAQGFIEALYGFVVSYSDGGYWQTDWMLGDDGTTNRTWLATSNFDRGNYRVYNYPDQNYFITWTNKGDPYEYTLIYRPGIYDGVKGIRKANIAIDNVELMINATQEEKDVILGQAYFFRAFFHHEIMKHWGRFPYIKEVLTDEYNLPRPATYKECALKADEDFQKAIQLLPVNWDDMSYGQKTFGNNKLRVTKGAAYAFQGLNLLFAASPLMYGSTNTYEYDTELASMAVDAFAEVLKLVDQGVYKLEEDYDKIFWKTSGSSYMPGGTEFIFNPAHGYHGKAIAQRGIDNKIVGGDGVIMVPTHNFIHNNFGMSNGLSIEDDLSGAYGIPTYDSSKPFENRDPRFYKWVIVDGDVLATQSAAGENQTAKLYTGGAHRGATGSPTGYMMKKFVPTLYSLWNEGAINTNNPMHLRMRLTDVYLMYAEALHAAKGNATTSSASYNLTAEQVINIMRDRAGVPHVNSSIVNNPNKFMDELRRERTVELAFEAYRWNDIRRWVLAHEDKYRIKTGLDFPEDHSYFREFQIADRICEYPQHYWLPFEPRETMFYEGFEQNPGW